MKKVCISTYCEASSYGSVLQAMGLKKALLDIGFDSFVVRDVPAPITRKNFPLFLSSSPKIMLQQFLNIPLNKKRAISHKRSVNYIKSKVDVRYYNDYNVLCKDPPMADYYLAGSDQIWHPDLCKPAFFLDFLPSDAKRISYAASMGKLEISKEKEDRFSKLASRFDSISVREQDMTDVLRKFTDKPILRHIDPTFLVEPDYWRSQAIEYKLDKPYILVYALYWNVDYNKELKKLHKKTGYDVVAICYNGYSRVWANKKIYDADPGQFLYLIDHAEAVISSSFHGVALSLILNKKLAPVVNMALPSRISSLLKTLDVESLPISKVMEFDVSKYEQINDIIMNEKQKGISYLKEVLADA